LTLSLQNASALINYVVNDALTTQLVGSLQTMFQMMTSPEFVLALTAKVKLDKPVSITKRLMAIPGFTVKGFASLVGSEESRLLRGESMKLQKSEDLIKGADECYGLQLGATSLANACLIKHFNRLGQLAANLSQLKDTLGDELANATQEVMSDCKLEDVDEEAYLKMLGFNPKMFEHTIEDIETVKTQVMNMAAEHIT
jgi:hypothetical protein